MKKIFFVKFFITLLIISIIVYKVDVLGALVLLKQFSFFQIFILFILFLLSYLLGVFNIFLLLKPLDKNMSIKFLNLAYHSYKAWLIGFVTPAKLGELYLAKNLKDHNIDYGKGIAVLVIDKIITVFVLIIASTIGAILYFKSNIRIYLILFFILFVILFIYIAISKIFRQFIAKYILRKHVQLFSGYFDTFVFYFKNNKSLLMIDLFITIIKLLISGIQLVYIFKIFNVSCYYLSVNSCSIISTSVMSSMASFLAILPISLGGLGIKEGSAIYLFELLSLDPSIVLTTYLILAIVSYLLGIILIIYFILRWLYLRISRS